MIDYVCLMVYISVVIGGKLPETLNSSSQVFISYSPLVYSSCETGMDAKMMIERMINEI